MEEMNIDQIVDIPDTPDRLAVRRVPVEQSGKSINSPIVLHSGDSAIHQQRARNRLHCEGLHKRASVHRNQTNLDEGELRINNVVITSHSLNSPLFRRPTAAPTLKNKGKIESGRPCSTAVLPGQVDRMAFFTDVSGDSQANVHSKRPVHPLKEAHFETGYNKTTEFAIPRPISGDQRKSSVSSSFPSSSHLSSSRMLQNGISKGKEKVDVNTNMSSSSADLGKGIELTGDSHRVTENESTVSRSSFNSLKNGRKRLVRNGCISPFNIAARAQKSPEIYEINSSTVKRDCAKKVSSDGPSQVDIRELVRDDKSDHHRAKGKEVFRQELKDCTINLVPTSGSVVHNKAGREISLPNKEVVVPWRKTREKLLMRHPTPVINDLVDVEHRNSERVVPKSTSSFSMTSEPNEVRATPTKRQRRDNLSEQSFGGCPSHVVDDMDILCLGSPPHSSGSRSSRAGSSCNRRSLNNDDSYAKAIQEEEDEMLAHQLQEQLYREEQIFGGTQIDENIAWALQQDEADFRATSSLHHSSVLPPRRSTRSLILSPGQAFQDHTVTGRSPVVHPSRARRLRSRIINRSAASSRNRNRLRGTSSRSDFHFPSGMDLDMRLDILEAMETVVNQPVVAGMTAHHMLQLHRDFDASDYEMLLALDDNIPQTGVSTNLINSLPESVVQTDNFEETCAICLENPSIGEKIRHLPCLHKFHKDCIDPWLKTKKLCPICKSSIT